LISIVVYAIAGSSGYFLSSLNEILIGRAILGIAVGGIMTTTTTLIADYFTGAKRNKIIDLQGAFMSIGGVLFLLTGGFLADIDWRAPFLIYLFSLFMLPLVLYSIKEPLIQQDKQQHQQQRSKESIFKIRSVYIVYPIAVFSMIIFYLIPVQMPFFLMDLTGVSSSEVGIAISFMTLSAAIIALSYKQVKSKLSFQNIFVLIFLLMGIGYFTISVSENYVLVIIGLIVSGLGMGLLLPNMNLLLVSATPQLLRGSAVGGLVSFISLGQFLSPLVGQPFFEMFGMNTTYEIAGISMLILSVIFVGYNAIRKSFRLEVRLS
jgi:MFS family permease